MSTPELTPQQANESFISSLEAAFYAGKTAESFDPRISMTLNQIIVAIQQIPGGMAKANQLRPLVGIHSATSPQALQAAATKSRQVGSVKHTISQEELSSMGKTTLGAAPTVETLEEKPQPTGDEKELSDEVQEQNTELDEKMKEEGLRAPSINLPAEVLLNLNLTEAEMLEKDSSLTHKVLDGYIKEITAAVPQADFEGASTRRQKIEKIKAALSA